MEKEQRANQIAEALEGTCKNLSDIATEAEQNDTELMDLVDDRVFECDDCGWWCEPSELSEHHEGQVCIDCE